MSPPPPPLKVAECLIAKTMHALCRRGSCRAVVLTHCYQHFLAPCLPPDAHSPTLPGPRWAQGFNECFTNKKDGFDPVMLPIDVAKIVLACADGSTKVRGWNGV